jgi:exosortase H (IPTLxxWG-CTERM-specific)
VVATPHAARRFVARFVVCAAVLYALTVTPFAREHVWEPYLRATARATGVVLKILGQQTTVVDAHVVSEDLNLHVKRGCDGIEPSELFWAATIAFPASLAQRVAGLLLGTLIIQLMNLARLAALHFVGRHSPQLFDLFHVEIGQVAFVILVLCLWYAWMEWVRRGDAQRSPS